MSTTPYPPPSISKPRTSHYITHRDSARTQHQSQTIPFFQDALDSSIHHAQISNPQFLNINHSQEPTRHDIKDSSALGIYKTTPLTPTPNATAPASQNQHLSPTTLPAVFVVCCTTPPVHVGDVPVGDPDGEVTEVHGDRPLRIQEPNPPALALALDVAVAIGGSGVSVMPSTTATASGVPVGSGVNVMPLITITPAGVDGCAPSLDVADGGTSVSVTPFTTTSGVSLGSRLTVVPLTVMTPPGVSVWPDMM